MFIENIKIKLIRVGVYSSQDGCYKRLTSSGIKYQIEMLKKQFIRDN